MQVSVSRTWCVVATFFAALLLIVPLAQAQTSGQAGEAQQSEPVLTERQKVEQRGDLYMARKQYPEAIEVYTGLLKKEPKNPVLLNKVGIAYYQMAQLDKAKRYYDRAIKADKNYSHAVNNLGMIHYNRKNYRQAIKYYRRAIDLQPQVATFHSNLGYAFFAQKKYDEALTSFQTALMIDPEILDRRGQFGSVLQDRSVQDRAFFYFFLAKSYAMQNNAEQCAHYLRRARDEGYKEMAAIPKDPAFASVLQNPLVQEILNPPPAAGAPPAKPTP